MAHRPHARGTTRDPHDGPWSVCDRCGFLWSQSRLQFQFDYLGGSVPQSLGLIVCRRCLDDLNFQQKLLILPPDPQPIFNTRPENYVVDETDWLTTEDGDTITTQDDEDFITSLPDPAQNADQTYLSATLAYPSGSVAVLYLDLFNGNPAAGGTSILAAVTGSATRTDVAASMASVAAYAENVEDITIISASLATSNVTHIGFYTAASAGTLLVSGTVSATTPTIVLGAAVTILAPNLHFNF